MTRTLMCIGLVAIACESDSADVPPAEISSYSLSGTVVDFRSGAAIDRPATVSTEGLNPAPTISVTGAEFEISGIPPHSVFYTLSGSPPLYRPTYNAASVVEDRDVDGVEASVVSEAYLADLASAFGVTPAPGGVVIARAVDAQGAPRAGVPGVAFGLDLGGDGPYFLDASKQAQPGATETSASGYALFYEVPTALVSVIAAPGAAVTIESPASPAAAGTVTLIDFVITDGPTPPPSNVSFSGDVFPIFARRGCEVCHSGSGIGRDLGGLTLDGSRNLVHRELTEELSPNHSALRVSPEAPAASLLLTLPSAEQPPDEHPNVTFASAGDRDYQLILVWIEEGARDN